MTACVATSVGVAERASHVSGKEPVRIGQSGRRSVAPMIQDG
jgi:hypothetical protein